MKEKILILLIFIFIFLITILFSKKDNFKNRKTVLIWRKDYKNHKDIETNLDNFLKNNKKILFITDHIDFKKLDLEIMKINKKFKIISDFGDFCLPYDNRNPRFSKEIFENIFNNHNLIEWYSTNINNYDKIKFLPLGIDYHTISERNNWGEEKDYPINQEKRLIKIYNKSQKNNERINKCFMCNHKNTSLSLKKSGYVKYDRHDINKELKNNKSMVICQNFIPRNNLWNTFVKYKFVLAPAGNGMDTHRLWEGLFLGCIVIVLDTGLNNFLKEFPVVVVKDLNEINDKNLNLWSEKYSSMCHNKEIRKKYFAKYWLDKILNFK